MQGTAIIELLALRMEDEDHDRFTKALKIDVLNNSQLRLINLLADDYFTEIQATDSVLPVSSAVDLSSLSPAIIRDRVTKVNDESLSKFYHMKNINQLKKLENTYFAPSADYLICYKHAGSLHLQPAPGANVTVWYLRKPVAIDDSATEQEIDESLVPIWLDLSEGQLWRMDKQRERAKDANEQAFTEITALNQRLEVEKAGSVGERS